MSDHDLLPAGLPRAAGTGVALPHGSGRACSVLGPQGHDRADRWDRRRAAPRWPVRDPNARRARQLPDGRHLHRGRPDRLAWIESATGMHTTSTPTTSATAQPKSSSVSGTFPRRCAYPRPAPVFAPPSTNSKSTSLASPRRTGHDRPAVLGGSDLHRARRSSPPRPLTRGTPVALREVDGAPCRRARDDADAVDPSSSRPRWQRRAATSPYFPTPWQRGTQRCQPTCSISSDHRHCTWQPPGGGATGALNHAVIHSLDITVALGRSAVAPAEAVTAVLDELTTGLGTLFGVDLTSVRLEAADADWSWGNGLSFEPTAALWSHPERPSATRRTGPCLAAETSQADTPKRLVMLLSCPRLPYVSSVDLADGT